ncbi:hypothetical protein VOLCADRAFT_103060 [Volvox carteri f. nagariensis]|uniref:FAD-binding domain-containing protein n=1 Tax=Volvox carteri f. nagariensis TaxID=3068 RepID=D8TJN3_VOLCA|nr:uncharacterized protein VOLCADRAFT_103060 [Volvox carteri f. nagariensis]EFJ52572.1 hypothetical protein VOLCADRAFT_103060 [Volvox carteri f. nagariensis]|eukprot:XP_002946645.1 hypothetical protein VOLCADRAFT_103060 [Volvox carteri f. nagariensis]
MTHGSQNAWVHGGLLLVGDAAHAGRADGQGANIAFEDAAVLGALVRQNGLGHKAFAAWEEVRQPRVRDILWDPKPDGATRSALIQNSAFEQLWCPLRVAAALPAGVRQEVQEAVARGGVEAGRQVVINWSQRAIRELVEAKAPIASGSNLALDPHYRFWPELLLGVSVR